MSAGMTGDTDGAAEDVEVVESNEITSAFVASLTVPSSVELFESTSGFFETAVMDTSPFG